MIRLMDKCKQFVEVLPRSCPPTDNTQVGLPQNDYVILIGPNYRNCDLLNLYLIDSEFGSFRRILHITKSGVSWVVFLSPKDNIAIETTSLNTETPIRRGIQGSRGRLETI